MRTRRAVERALDAVERRALFGDRVDWPVARRRVLDALGDRAELRDRMRTLVREAGGVHSGLIATRRPADPPALPSIRSVGAVGVLRIPACHNHDAARYVAAGVAAFAGFPGLARWVVDLRGNGGGSMWPMLAVASPLLGGDGTVGYFVDRDGVRSPWVLRSGRVSIGRRVLARWPGPRTLDGPVAVLTDGRTASSGEAVATAFRGVPDARSFGSATRGFSTANETIRLPGGVALLVTTARFADRTGRVYGQALVPDVEVAGDALGAVLER